MYPAHTSAKQFRCLWSTRAWKPLYSPTPFAKAHQVTDLTPKRPFYSGYTHTLALSTDTLPNPCSTLHHSCKPPFLYLLHQLCFPAKTEPGITKASPRPWQQFGSLLDNFSDTAQQIIQLSPTTLPKKRPPSKLALPLIGIKLNPAAPPTIMQVTKTDAMPQIIETPSRIS
ncbi:hypothetical protein C0989_008043 [Termitomyces sp. Mn162]|nr:hypothetical protein C0989_008043 [Termitomyces sp. Mn162]